MRNNKRGIKHRVFPKLVFWGYFNAHAKKQIDIAEKVGKEKSDINKEKKEEEKVKKKKNERKFVLEF